jgi:serine/threonine protein phosphatase PrpC
VQLRGRDYTVLGHLAAVELPEAGALALTRGAHPKAYAHVDPNEDGALVLSAEAGTLLTVVDGHHGCAASELALHAVHEAWIELLRDDDQAFRHAVEAVVARVGDELRSAGKSRTCLLVATCIGERCRWACLGDCTLLRSHSSAPIHPPNPLILRPDLSLQKAEHWCGAFSAEPGERIAAVTDGATNFVQDLEELRAILGSAPGDLEAARDLVSAAMRAGAGDNVAAATCVMRAAPERGAGPLG